MYKNSYMLFISALYFSEVYFPMKWEEQCCPTQFWKGSTWGTSQPNLVVFGRDFVGEDLNVKSYNIWQVEGWMAKAQMTLSNGPFMPLINKNPNINMCVYVYFTCCVILTWSEGVNTHPIYSKTDELYLTGYLLDLILLQTIVLKVVFPISHSLFT